MRDPCRDRTVAGPGITAAIEFDGILICDGVDRGLLATFEYGQCRLQEELARVETDDAVQFNL